MAHTYSTLAEARRVEALIVRNRALAVRASGYMKRGHRLIAADLAKSATAADLEQQGHLAALIADHEAAAKETTDPELRRAYLDRAAELRRQPPKA